MSTLKEWALWYVDHTPFRVFPLAPGAKEPLAGSHGFKDATRDHARIEELWRYANCNIGAATGAGIFALDLDCKNEGEDGSETLRELERDAGKIPEETWTALTASGGTHIYFKTSLAVGLDNHDTYPDIDIHGEGGYTVLPPSRLKNGREYTWETGFAPWECQLAEANDAVIKLFIEPLSGKAGEEGKRQRFKLHGKIKQSARNNTLCQAACSMQGTGFPDEVIEVAIVELNRVSCSPPLSDDEVRKIIDSVLRNYEKGGGRSWKRNSKQMELLCQEEALLRQKRVLLSKK